MTAKFRVDVFRSATQWCFYLLHHPDQGVQYFGVCPYGQIFGVPDARKNPLFKERFENVDAIVEVLYLTANEQQAIQCRARYMKDHPTPFMNKYGAPVMIGTAVKCVETGEIFRTQTECWKAHQIHSSNLSTHLKTGKPKTIGGRTYVRHKQTAVPLHIHQPAVPLHTRPLVQPSQTEEK